MASRANRRQIISIAFLEGLTNMLQNQGGHLQEDPYFQSMRADILRSATEAYRTMLRDPSGGLSASDVARAKQVIEVFRQKAFSEFIPEQATSFAIALLSDQIVMTKNPAKRKAFEAVLEAAENLHVYFDPNCEYEAPESFQAACVFDQLNW
jgi:hypothetical protein